MKGESLNKFVLFLIVVVAIVVGVYYYYSVQPRQTAPEPVKEEPKPVPVKKGPPPNVFMEDGTVPDSTE